MWRDPTRVLAGLGGGGSCGVLRVDERATAAAVYKQRHRQLCDEVQLCPWAAAAFDPVRSSLGLQVEQQQGAGRGRLGNMGGGQGVVAAAVVALHTAFAAAERASTLQALCYTGFCRRAGSFYGSSWDWRSRH